LIFEEDKSLDIPRRKRNSEKKRNLSKGNAMAKKIVSLLTMVAFLVFTQVCTIYSTKKISPDVAAQKAGQDVRIMRVMKTSGEMVEFEEKNPGYIVKDAVVGRSNIKETVEVSRDNIKLIQHQDNKKIIYISTKDGKTYSPIISYKEMPDKIVLEAYKTESIPFTDIEMIWLKERNPGASTLATLGVVAAVAGGTFLAVLAIVALTKGTSCPILYARDNMNFEREGEIYSGAVFREIERTDYLKLHHLAEHKGAYTLKISNEAEETQYTDEVNLLVVDHPKGSSVFVGSDGVVHMIQNPIPAVSAEDLKGTDFTAALKAPDNRMWSANPFHRNPENPADLKSGITLKFPKPVEAQKAKLVVRLGNTFWVDNIFVRFIGLMGDSMNPWYHRTAQSPQFKERAESFVKKQGIALRAQLLEEGKWKDIGYFHPTGPVGLQDDILEFPVDGMLSNTLTIKLDGGTFFWMIDYAAIDYSADLAAEINEVAPVEAIDESGQDVRESLFCSDDISYTMPKPGNFAVLKFPAPPKKPDIERSFILESEGYYNIHPQKEGPPDLETLLALQRNPDNFLKFSLREFARTFPTSATFLQK
jgi:hypothetical protein